MALFFFYADEEPDYNSAQQIKLYKQRIPADCPDSGSKEYIELELFSKNIQIILQTVNENEYQAAAVEMKPPTKTFKSSVFFPSPSIVVGMFGRNRAALIQTDVGSNCREYIEDAIEQLPGVKYVIGVGVCYAFNKEKYKCGDVLVSRMISDFRNFKFDHDKFVNRGETISIDEELIKIFCNDLTLADKFMVSASRSSQVHCGIYVSYPALVNDIKTRDKFQAAVPEVIGGEMEGGELLRLQKKNKKIEGVIVIKGIADYADGSKDKKWQCIAAKAAINYAKTKLDRVPFYDGTDNNIGML